MCNSALRIPKIPHFKVHSTTDDKAVFLEKYEKKGTIASDCMMLCDKYLSSIDLLQMAAYVVYSNFLVTHTLSSSLYPKAQEAVEEVRLRGCFA